MAELATLARPYAAAVFSLAKRTKRLPEWSRILDYLATATGNPQMARYLAMPEITAEAKAYRLADVCGDVMNDAARNFVNVLAANRRLNLIGFIRDQYEELRAQEDRVLDVEVVSAYELDTAERDRIIAALKKRHQKDVQLTEKVDPALLGGAIVRAGDVVVDGTVRGRLEKLVDALTR
jgi:F-type H+-transporting ATPase subunit delta